VAKVNITVRSFYYFWLTCGCQQYKAFQFCQGNAAVGSLCFVVEFKNT